MNDEIQKPPEAVIFGEDLLSTMNQAPGSCDLYKKLRKKIDHSKKLKGGRFYEDKALAFSYLSKLQDIHFPHCTAYDNVSPKLKGTMHP